MVQVSSFAFLTGLGLLDRRVMYTYSYICIISSGVDRGRDDVRIYVYIQKYDAHLNKGLMNIVSLYLVMSFYVCLSDV